MSAAVIRKITNEDDVWSLLKEFSTSTTALNNIRMQFENFPHVSLKYNGVNFESAIPIRVMDAMKVIQSEIYRVYSLVVYEDELYCLSQEEKDSLELFFQVSAGSSGVEPKNLPGILNLIVEKASAKMEGRHFVVVALIAAATYGTIKVNEANNKTSEEIARIEATGDRDRAENERLQILKSIIERNEPAKKAAESAERVNESVAKSVKREESVTFSDSTIITEVVAKEMYPRSRRRTAQEIRMDGLYTIERVDKKSDDLRIEILNTDGRKFTAAANDIGIEQQQVLFNAVNSTAMLEINAKDLEGDIKDVVIIKVETPTVVTSKDGN